MALCHHLVRRARWAVESTNGWIQNRTNRGRKISQVRLKMFDWRLFITEDFINFCLSVAIKSSTRNLRQSKCEYMLPFVDLLFHYESTGWNPENCQNCCPCTIFTPLKPNLPKSIVDANASVSVSNLGDLVSVVTNPIAAVVSGYIPPYRMTAPLMCRFEVPRSASAEMLVVSVGSPSPRPLPPMTQNYPTWKRKKFFSGVVSLCLLGGNQNFCFEVFFRCLGNPMVFSRGLGQTSRSLLCFLR